MQRRKTDLLYHIIKFLSRKDFIMDPEPSVIKELIIKALEECDDTSTLYLVYELLTYEA